MAEMSTVQGYETRARQLFAPDAVSGLFPGPENPIGKAIAENIGAFERTVLRPRVMVDITEQHLATSVLGQKVALPVLLGAVGGLRRFHPEGERAVARAASAAGTLMALSTASSYSLEAVASACDAPRWFQLYVLKDRALTEHLVRRAEAAGYRAIVITVDTPGYRSREREAAYAHGHADVGLGNFEGIAFENLPNARTWLDAKSISFTWQDIAWIRSLTRLPLIIKGIQTGEDALLCVQHGLDGLVVSNHGGFSLPDAGGTLSLLPEIAAAAGSKLEIYLDGGVRSGRDVLKALALGARAVFIGRPMIFGLIVDGEQGVAKILEILAEELRIAMGLCGVVDVRKLERALVRAPRSAQA